MAGMRKRRIKFALELKDGMEARSLEELQEHFDVNKVVGYFQDGKLLTWLEDRFYDDEADAVRKLSGKEGDLGERLCQIFQIEQLHKEDAEAPETIAWRRERLERLKQFTAADDILKDVDLVAFDQDDLEEIIHEEETDKVYLCPNNYVLPSGLLRRKGIRYIGIGKNVEVVIKSKEVVDFDSLCISFENIKLDEAYERIKVANSEKVKREELPVETKDVVEKESEEEIKRRDFLDVLQGTPKEIIDFALRAEECGDFSQAEYLYQFILNKPENELEKWILLGALKRLAYLCREGIVRKKNYDRAFMLYAQAARNGDADSMSWMGYFYENGIGCKENKNKAAEWYSMAAEAGDVVGMVNLANMYKQGEGGLRQDYAEALRWFRKAAEEGNAIAMYYLGGMYSNGEGVAENIDTALEWYRKSAEAGDEDAIELLRDLEENEADDY